MKNTGDTIELVLDRTPFYAESGGQIGDHGIITVPGQHPGQPPAAVLHVGDVTNAAGGDLSVHRAEVLQGRVQCGDKVCVCVVWVWVWWERCTYVLGM